MRPERQGYQPPVLDNDQSASSMNFSSGRAPFGASRTFGQVAQTLNLGAQGADWIQVPRSTQGTNTERSETEPTETPRSTLHASTGRGEPDLVRHPSFTLDTNQRRSLTLPIHTSSFTLGANERRNESERARFLDPRLDRLGQRRQLARQEAVQTNHESCCDVCESIGTCSMERIGACCSDMSDQRKPSDIVAFQVLFLILLQLLVIAILTMVCLQNDDKADSVVHSHKWVLGLSFPMCFSVLIARVCCKEGFQILPVNIIMFLMWSAGVVLTTSWITVLLSFDFLSLLIFFLLLWTASVFISGVICVQPLLSYCSVLLPLGVIGTSIALFITVGSKSIISVSFASSISMLIFLYLVWRLFYLTEDCSPWSEENYAFYIATCILF